MDDAAWRELQNSVAKGFRLANERFKDDFARVFGKKPDEPQCECAEDCDCHN